MGRLINETDSPSAPAPSWRKMHVHGKVIWLEAQSLALWEGGAAPPRNILPRLSPIARQRPKPARNPSLVVLLPTFGCNLRCKYCYGEYDTAPAQMSPTIARRAVGLLSGPRLRLSFFGGEPMLAFDLVRETVNYAEGIAAARKSHTVFGMTTNGVLVDESAATWFAQHRFAFIISLDGPEELHDRNRVDAEGKGTWARVVKAAETLTKARVRALALRSTFTPEDVHLLDRVKYLNGLVRRGVGTSISVEPTCLSEHEHRRTRGTRGFEARDLRALAAEYHELAIWMLDEWRAGRRPKHMQLERMTRRLLEQHAHASTCGAGNGYWTVGPDGTIYSCHHASEWCVIGNLKTGIDGKARKRWIDNRLFNSPRCAACHWRFVCGGACRDDAMRCNNEMWTPSKVHCAIKWMWIREAIWMISEASHDGILDRLRETADRPVNMVKGCCDGCGASCQLMDQAGV